MPPPAVRIRRAVLLTFLGSAGCAASCTADPDAPPFANVAEIPIGECIAAAEDSGGAEPAACPGFLAATVTGALQVCREAGGRLSPMDPPTIWSLDVNGDARPEFVFETNDIVQCEDAWSIFSCGSLGCPKALYGERAGGWQMLGGISAWSQEQIEVTANAHPDGYRDLGVACAPGHDCAEYWHYVWRDGHYESTAVDVRGHRVAFADSVHGLYALVADTTLLATPTPDAAPLERYDAGTEVAIIGTAEAGGHYYVSPCNACTSGFVPVAALGETGPPPP